MKAFGYNNIKIYNGGLKDWQKSNFKTETLEKLPDVEAKFLTAEELLTKIASAGPCQNKNDEPTVTVVDLRTEHHLENVDRPLVIQTTCPTIFCLLDDLQKETIRRRIPKDGLVVTITETGNRDIFAIQYLSKYGYQNIQGLLFGMRGWIKAGYQTQRP